MTSLLGGDGDLLRLFEEVLLELLKADSAELEWDRTGGVVASRDETPAVAFWGDFLSEDEFACLQEVPLSVDVRVDLSLEKFIGDFDLLAL